MSTLPVSRLISIGVNLSPLAAQSQNLSSLLILGTSAVIDTNERMRSYTSLLEVGADLGTNTEEYLAAELWYEQTPNPSGLLYIGRWCKTAASAQLVGSPLSAAHQLIANFTAITDGGLDIAVDAGASQNLTGLNLSAVTNLNGVASAINAHLTGAVVTWDANNEVFRVASNSTGATSQVSFATAPTGTGVTDIGALMGLKATSSGAYLAPGVAAETALAALNLFDSEFGGQWYEVTIPDASDADHTACGAYCEASDNAHFYKITTQEAGVLVASVTTDIASVLKAAGYNKTATQFSSTSPYAGVSLAAKMLSVNYTGTNTTIDAMWQQEPGVTPETLNSPQEAACLAKNCNVYVANNNGTAIIEKGVCASGINMDTIIGIDNFKIALQTALFNVNFLAASNGTKVPQEDSGMHQYVVAIQKICKQFVTNGLFAPGFWNYAGFGALQQGQWMPDGFYVYANPIASQSQAARAARQSTLIQVAVNLAGAVQTVNLLVSVNQ